MEHDLIVRGRSERTREAYLHAVAALARYYRPGHRISSPIARGEARGRHAARVAATALHGDRRRSGGRLGEPTRRSTVFFATSVRRNGLDG